MGKLIEGKWHDVWYDTKKTGGKFVRQDSSFRDWVGPAPANAAGVRSLPAEPGRYHLYVSLACPWAHRTLILRALKGLEPVISLSVVHPHMGKQGWHFGSFRNTLADPVLRADHLHQIYTAADPTYTGRVTVPILWDKQRQTIVNNESSEIIRMLNSGFDTLAQRHYDFYPEPARVEIDDINELVYHRVNNGVYKAGFATRQEVYEEAVTALFEALDMLESRLSRRRYLVGERMTEADWRLFTTLVRFDAVYVGHFKCNLRRIADYPNLANYLRELYQIPGIADTVDMEHIKSHYYTSHDSINPNKIVPMGPLQDLTAVHDRARLPGMPLERCVFPNPTSGSGGEPS